MLEQKPYPIYCIWEVCLGLAGISYTRYDGRAAGTIQPNPLAVRMGPAVYGYRS